MFSIATEVGPIHLSSTRYTRQMPHVRACARALWPIITDDYRRAQSSIDTTRHRPAPPGISSAYQHQRERCWRRHVHNLRHPRCTALCVWLQVFLHVHVGEST